MTSPHECPWCRCADPEATPGVGRVNVLAPFYGLVLEVDRLICSRNRDTWTANLPKRPEVEA